jgi:3-oxoacyl-[acyl-carrier protein] reductase
MSGSGAARMRVALVTGAGGGIGLACCEALAQAGMHVIATDIDGAAAAAVDKALNREGLSSSSAVLDVCDREAVESFFNGNEHGAGDISVLVNLAGVIRNALLIKVTDEDFRLTFATHVEGTLNTMRAAFPKMRENGYGRIVNMSSVAAKGAVGGTSYNTAKGAIESLTQTAALEFAKYGITADCVAAGPLDSGMFRTVPLKYQEEIIARIPMGRPGKPEELAQSIAFLASESASYITGQTLTLCGGYTVGI